MPSDPPLLIGLYSPAPQCGKSTVAQHLFRCYGFAVHSFADPMRAMIRTLLSFTGNSSLPEDKEAPITALAGQPSLRHLMRTLGTEWGRECISEEFWTGLWATRARQTMSRGQSVVCDDVRFPDEFHAIRLMGGELWCIDRPRFVVLGEERHRSDGGLEDPSYSWDVMLCNDGSIDNLIEQVEARLNRALPSAALRG